MMPATDRNELIEILQRMSRAGINRVPKKQKEAGAVLALSLADLDRKGIFDETEIDDHLIKWLSQLSIDNEGIDHVTWRRALVDMRFLRRATDGAIYRIRRETIDQALTADAQTVDPLAVFDDAALARSERQAQFSQDKT